MYDVKCSEFLWEYITTGKGKMRAMPRTRRWLHYKYLLKYQTQGPKVHLFAKG